MRRRTIRYVAAGLAAAMAAIYFLIGLGVAIDYALVMIFTVLMPAAIRHQTELAQNVAALKAAGVDADTDMLTEVSPLVTALRTGIGALRNAIETHGGETTLEEATHAASLLAPMGAVRTTADALEHLVADDLWPLPTYQEMLYIL